ncbi:uncharacterized protein LOC119603173 [Lucilia sericata]|uniref:uncharacterized protein LOC119603173 n=1 Tax=Lucilia sericata TaxID=13632 RepID=UPI0018A8063C|nr:uncharacterized protein LOC119603173 [Lucilia sericata]
MEIFSNLCRSCNIEKEKLVNIHNSKQTSIMEMLEYCLQTTIINEPKFPQFICYDCIKQLEISYRFIKRFNLAQREFEETYERLQKIGTKANIDSPIEVTIEETHGEELEEKSVHVVSEDSIKTADKLIINSSDIYLPLKETKPIQQLSDFIASTSSPNTEVPSAHVTSPAIICSLCSKSFFTTKALHLHLKLSHKQKIANT